MQVQTHLNPSTRRCRATALATDREPSLVGGRQSDIPSWIAQPAIVRQCGGPAGHSGDHESHWNGKPFLWPNSSY